MKDGDKELLELAAIAARYSVYWNEKQRAFYHDSPPPGHNQTWVPLDDDGDALRLASRLRYSIIHTTRADGAPIIKVGDILKQEAIPARLDDNAQVRRAIVSAAANYGKTLRELEWYINGVLS